MVVFCLLSKIDICNFFTDSSLQQLEQHQAKELLYRFKELRQWQHQQQQQLMFKQQHQLQTWQDEQNKLQTLLAHHKLDHHSLSQY